MDESQQKIAKAYFYMSLIAIDKHKKLIVPAAGLFILALILLYVNVMAFQTGRLDYFIFLLLGGLLGIHLEQTLATEIDSMESASSTLSNMWSTLKAVFTDNSNERKFAEAVWDMSPDEMDRMERGMENFKAFMDNYGKYVLSWVPSVLYLSALYGIYGVSRIAYQRYGEPVLQSAEPLLAKVREVKLK